MTDWRATTKQIAEEVSAHGRRAEWEVLPPSDDLPSILLHTDALTAAAGVARELERWVFKDIFTRDAPVTDDEIDRCGKEVEVAVGILHRGLASLTRDIFGNPFRPVTFSPFWRTDTALSLARQMYESRDFSAMPILADALQDAGCDSPEVLDHCRGDGPHVRGCWVVDLVLGKG
ncbi:hypothetical protein R5W23_001819 [Gemmata sp. JC673]|uniref:SMI1/KNR4 family protein n=1 Tax=Gemmata algarum TaxID=2975278 RepID=A0ABU5EZ38_9BACT|nr:hypothetical protein [Gemmata algarum]MDY3560575.1 hypothetical protein [Gemmata algarum]